MYIWSNLPTKNLIWWKIYVWASWSASNLRFFQSNNMCMTSSKLGITTSAENPAPGSAWWPFNRGIDHWFNSGIFQCQPAMLYRSLFTKIRPPPFVSNHPNQGVSTTQSSLNTSTIHGHLPITVIVQPCEEILAHRLISWQHPMNWVPNKSGLVGLSFKDMRKSNWIMSQRIRAKNKKWFQTAA